MKVDNISPIDPSATGFYRRKPCPASVSERLSPATVFSSLPESITNISEWGALRQLLISSIAFTTAYYCMYALPMWLIWCLPILWLCIGAMMAGLMSIAIDCSNNRSFRWHWLNHALGWAVMLPLLTNFEHWTLQYNLKSSLPSMTEYRRSFDTLMIKVSQSYFWWASSAVQTVTSLVPSLSFLQTAPPGRNKRVMANCVTIYVAILTIIPFLVWKLGVWGVFKYYIIPWLCYHFWSSTAIKSKYANLCDVDACTDLVYTRFPQWVEFLSNDLNTLLGSVRCVVFDEIRISHDSSSEDTGNRNALSSLFKYESIEEHVPSYNSKRAVEFVISNSSLQVEEQSWTALFALPKTIVWHRIRWVTGSFLIITPSLGLYGMATTPFNSKTYLTAFILYSIACLGITIGYYRCFAHRSFDCHWSIRWLITICGTSAFESSVLDWSKDHRAHHRYTDTDKDPYSIKKGFWHAHWGWLFLAPEKEARADISDLQADPILRFQHKYYSVLAVLFGIMLPTLICGYGWGDFRGGFFIAGILARVVVMHSTFCINSVAHYMGDITYSTISARDNWVTSLITFGEGFHNGHHEFPFDVRNGHKFYHWDPSKWIIYIFSYLGLAWNLHFVPDDEVEKGRLQMEERRLKERRDKLHWGPPDATLPEWTRADVAAMCSGDTSTTAMKHEQSSDNRENLLIVDGYVHDVTLFMDEHPGGKKLIKSYIGRDASKAMRGGPGGIYDHKQHAHNVLQTLRVARLKADPVLDANFVDQDIDEPEEIKDMLNHLDTCEKIDPLTMVDCKPQIIEHRSLE